MQETIGEIMRKSLILGSLFAAIVMFIWMAISWMVIPWHSATLGKFTNEETVASAILSNTTTSGIYVLPSCESYKEMEKKEKMEKKAPVIFSSIMREGRDYTSPKPYLISFIIDLLGTIFVTSLVLMAKLPTFGARLIFVTLFGVAAGMLAAFPDWNWWGFSFSFTIVKFLDFFIGWFLAGIVIAFFTKRAKAIS